MGWMPITFLFLLRPFPISHYYSTRSINSLPFSSPPEYNQKVWGKFVRLPTLQRKNESVAKVGGEIHLVPTIFGVGCDASHGSQRVAAPMASASAAAARADDDDKRRVIIVLDAMMRCGGVDSCCTRRRRRRCNALADIRLRYKLTSPLHAAARFVSRHRPPSQRRPSARLQSVDTR